MGQSRRIALGNLLKETSGIDRVYFQPFEGFKLEYPCIIYNRDTSDVDHADNSPYRVDKRYLVTVIDRDPDSPIPDRIEWLPRTTFERFFIKDQLNHYIFKIYH